MPVSLSFEVLWPRVLPVGPVWGKHREQWGQGDVAEGICGLFPEWAQARDHHAVPGSLYALLLLYDSSQAQGEAPITVSFRRTSIDDGGSDGDGGGDDDGGCDDNDGGSGDDDGGYDDADGGGCYDNDCGLIL